MADSSSADRAKQGSGRPFLLVLVVAAAVFGFGMIASLTGGTTSGEAVVDDTVVEIIVPTAPFEPQDPILGIPYSGNRDVGRITRWIPGDSPTGPLPPGEGGRFLGTLYLDFLSEFCDGNSCFRDAVMRNLDDSQPASEPYDDYAFVIRHGFLNDDVEPLGDGYTVDVYIRKEYGTTTEEGGFEIGTIYKFSSDYVMRGTAEQCGPTYKSQSSPVECEWFIHEFPDGLPDGRYDLWAVWRAPCSAWLSMGLTDSCVVDNEVLSLFSAAVNSPFGIEGN